MQAAQVGPQVQIVSSFTSALIEPSLSRVLLCGDVADRLGFTQYGSIVEYVLGTSSAASHIVGTLVLLRVEDWLRPDLKSPDCDSVDGSWVRQRLRLGVEETVSQLTTLASRGKQVWFVACPSSGWIAGRHKLGALCRTYTNLLSAQIENIPGITILKWPADLFRGEIDDHGADRLGQMPYTREAFHQLGEILGAQITRTFVRGTPSLQSVDGATSPELAAYLAGLRVQVELTPAGPSDRHHVDRLLRIPATFTISGERNELSDAEVDALIASGTCMLIQVSDRLSHYGPSGVIHFMADMADSDALAVTSMTLSCAVLGKQVEYAAVSALAGLAAERGFAKLVFEYTPAGRNQPTRAFLQSIATEQSETRYVLPVHSAKARLRAAAVSLGAWTAAGQQTSMECRVL
jgi:hypothetical protein